MSPVALVTGGARRIGAAIVKEMHRSGFDVVVHHHQSKNDAVQLVAYLNQLRANSAFALCQHFQKPKDATTVMDTIMQHYGRLDVMIHNASVFYRSDVLHLSQDDAMWTTNVFVPYWLNQAGYPYLAKNKGVIIHITDIHAAKPLRGYSVYCQTKAALNMQTLSLAKEFAPDVRVNAVAPGAMIWPEGDNVLSDDAKKSIIEQIPLGIHGHPEWIAMAVRGLVENPYITGQILSVDGGRSLG